MRHVMYIPCMLVFLCGISFAEVRLSGVVQDDSGQGIPGAQVTLTGTTLSATTQSNGQFLIEGYTTGSLFSNTEPTMHSYLDFRNSRISVWGASNQTNRISAYNIQGRLLCRVSGTGVISTSLNKMTGLVIIAVYAGQTRHIVRAVAINGRLLCQGRTKLSSGLAPKQASQYKQLPKVSGFNYLSAEKDTYLPGTAAVKADTASNIIITLLAESSFSGGPAYLNPSLPVEERVADLIARMTFEEKLSLTKAPQPAIPRLGMAEYNFRNEALHGAPYGTCFPQSIGIGATWNPDITLKIGTVIADEARARYHAVLEANGGTGKHDGITFFAPNINIVRDPRWGRSEETYGEDPYLTSKIGVAYIQGLQGNHPKYLKNIATPKHYAVFSGPVNAVGRYTVASESDIRMTYLPAFRASIMDGNAFMIMCSYNRINGEIACSHSHFLSDILRGEWGFKGFVVTDCCNSPSDASAGCDMHCCYAYTTSYSESVIDNALKNILTARFKLGMFDPPEMVPYASIPTSIRDCSEHRQLARTAGQESIVLLKNANNLLPLSKNLRSIAVIGPNANEYVLMRGNYYWAPGPRAYSPYEGIQSKLPLATVTYVQGCTRTGTSTTGFAEAIALAESSDAAIVVLGLHPTDIEGEGVDRNDIILPGVQEDLLKAIYATGTPTVLVLVNGAAVAVNWADSAVPAIVEAWYTGEEGGNAIADVLFGDYNPGGKLPVTFYKSINQLPDYEDYDMTKGRTYRYFADQPLYPFGYGLSYSTFEYSNLQVLAGALPTTDTVSISVDVQNTGLIAGDEVVQLYISDSEASATVPIKELKGFKRITLMPGEKKTVVFDVTPYQLSFIDTRNKRIVEPGLFEVSVGGCQPGPKQSSNVLAGSFLLTGEVFEVGL